MNPQAALKRAARFEYAVLRTPLHVVNDRVVQRCLSENSPVRRSFEGALRGLDETIGRLLSEPEAHEVPSPRPSSDSAASSPSDRATRPAPVAPSERDSPQTVVDAAARVLAVDEIERIDTLTDQLLDQEETQNFAGELAENDDLRHIQAELKAKQFLEEQEG
jgi:hypothetical protein